MNEPRNESRVAGEESIPASEQDHIEEILAILRGIQERKDRRNRPVPRNVHPKQHGCVLAELQIGSDVPEDLRHGVFREPRVFSALVRFSNARQQDDRLPDGHGMAIKLLDVEGDKLLESEPDGRTQDFVLIDHPVFFARDVADLVPLVHDFERLMIGDPVAKAGTVLKAMLSREHRYQLLRQTTAKRPDNPLEIQYWSTTPFRLGPGAMKFSVLPHLDALPKPTTSSADRLRVAMAAYLREREARFDLLVQRQTDPATMPIEDATVRWDEGVSPYVKVATLRIPAQGFESAEQSAFGENLSFTPWHALVEHRPLGGINRARRKIYEHMSVRRRESNGVTTPREPTLEQARSVLGSEPRSGTQV